MIEVKVHERIGLLAAQRALGTFSEWEDAFPELPDEERWAISEHLRSLENTGESIPATLWVEISLVRDGAGGEWTYQVPAVPDPEPDQAQAPYTPFDPYKAKLEALDLERRILEVQLASARLPELPDLERWDPDPGPGPGPSPTHDPGPGPGPSYTSAPYGSGSGSDYAPFGHLWNIDRKLGGPVAGMPGFAGAVLFEYMWPWARGLTLALVGALWLLGSVTWWVAVICLRVGWELSWVMLKVMVAAMTLGVVSPGRGRRRRR